MTSCGTLTIQLPAADKADAHRAGIPLALQAPKIPNCREPIPKANILVVAEPRTRADMPTSLSVRPSLVWASVRKASIG
eukprot:scaffold2276_cov160-Amphora_coffeaeformis.AAC.10